MGLCLNLKNIELLCIKRCVAKKSNIDYNILPSLIFTNIQKLCLNCNDKFSAKAINELSREHISARNYGIGNTYKKNMFMGTNSYFRF